MTLRTLPLLLALLIPMLAARAADTPAPEPAYPPFVLGNTQLRPLPRSADGRDYLLYVMLPGSYATSPERRYPVVYLCDAYWGFTLLNALSGSLVYDRVVPEFIVVGIGYAGENLDYNKLRQWELPPVPTAEEPDSGHADRFLAALEREIIPAVERDLRADPAHRVLLGSSYGGAFTLYAMLHRTDLFSGYIAVSPAVDIGRPWAFEDEAAFAAAHSSLPTRLFMSVGTCEWAPFVDQIRRFEEQLQSRHYEGFAHQFRLIEGERHGATNAEATNRGLRFIFEPLAPETGIQKD